MQNVGVKFNPRCSWQTQPFSKKKAVFTSKLDLKFKEERRDRLHLDHSSVLVVKR